MHSPESGTLKYGIHSFSAASLRGFQQLDLDFGRPPRPITVIIGRNGTCKTTLLRAIAVALASRTERSALLAHSFGSWIRRGSNSTELRIAWTDGQAKRTSGLLVRLQDGQESPVKDFSRSSGRKLSSKAFICAYGLGRSVAGAEPSGDYRLIDSVASLFRYESKLSTSELVLRRLFDFLGQSRFDRLLRSLKKALGLDERYEIRLPTGGGIEVEGPGIGGAITLDAWADGYRMTFLWLIDLFGWAMRAQAFDENGDIEGIVLVDEIEQHLHPSMQRGLLAHLRSALPKVQWIVTTHSPLVALAAGQESIVALHRRRDVIFSAEVPDLSGYSAEDILEEEALFGTDPASPETRERLDRIHELQRKSPAQRSPDEAKELSNLGAALDPSRLPYLRDDPTLAKLDQIEALLRSGKGKS